MRLQACLICFIVLGPIAGFLIQVGGGGVGEELCRALALLHGLHEAQKASWLRQLHI